MPRPMIVGICGSPRKASSRTAQLVKGVLLGARAAGAESEYVDVTTLDVEFCVACDHCHSEGECVHEDDLAALLAKLQAADGIVLGSPSYLFQMTAQLKTFVDRLSLTVHCQLLLGRYGAAVSTSGVSGHVETATALEVVLQVTGVQTVGHLACALPGGPVALNAPEMAAAEALGRKLVEAIREETEFPQQLARMAETREYFRGVIESCRDERKWEWEYYRKQHWL